ncbi:IS5 family transposase [Micromonospora tarensis]|uniref:IS5 family transposase n=1 Tax=Micromonospora tarensis TaxID=2806100 RepID=UPI0038990AA3
MDRAGAPACPWRPQKGLPNKSGDAWCARWRGNRPIPRRLSTKFHLAVDGRGRPLSILFTPGQAGDNAQLLALLDAICLNKPGPGRPRKRPEVLIADKGYAHDSTRRTLRQRGIRHVIPERSDQVARRVAKGSAGGRPPALDKVIYKKRNVVEGCFNRLKQWRDLATRYAKRASLYRASLVLIAAVIWLPGST